MIYKFYDTAEALLNSPNAFLTKSEMPVLSSMVIHDLAKSEEGLEILINNLGNYDTYLFQYYMLSPIIERLKEPIAQDIKGLAAAFDYDLNRHPDETVFVTENQELALTANLFFGEDSIILI